MRISKLNQLESEVKQGTLLCATPINPQSELLRSLVLVTRHSSLGSIGVILNRAIGVQIQVSNLKCNSKTLKLHYGGIVDEGLSFLVSMSSAPEGWKHPFYWSSNFNDLQTILGYIGSENATVNAYTGCIRWRPGELNEQADRKHWWTTDKYSLEDLSVKGENAWYSIARKTGGHLTPLLEINKPILFN